MAKKFDEGKADPMLIPEVFLANLRSESPSLLILQELSLYNQRKTVSIQQIKAMVWAQLTSTLTEAEILLRQAAVMTTGAGKYGRGNWKQGAVYSRFLAALGRHLLESELGDGLDSESGQPHLVHALCNISFLEHFDANYEIYSKFDDRPGGGTSSSVIIS